MNKQINKYQSRKGSVALWHSLCTLLLRRETAGEWDGTKEQREGFIPKWAIRKKKKKKSLPWQMLTIQIKYDVNTEYYNIKVKYVPERQKQIPTKWQAKKTEHFGMQPFTHTNNKHEHKFSHPPMRFVPSLNINKSHLFLFALNFLQFYFILLASVTWPAWLLPLCPDYYLYLYNMLLTSYIYCILISEAPICLSSILNWKIALHYNSK